MNEKKTPTTATAQCMRIAHTHAEMPKWKMIEKLAFLFEVFISSNALWDAREELSAEKILDFILIYDVMPSALRTSSYEIQTEKSWGTKLFTGQICGERDDNRKAENIPI